MNNYSLYQCNNFTKTDLLTKNGIKYKVAVTNKRVIKLGYYCETKGTIYPIYLTLNDGSEVAIKPNNYGIIEYQPYITNNDEMEYIVITKILIPANITFTLDYLALTN